MRTRSINDVFIMHKLSVARTKNSRNFATYLCAVCTDCETLFMDSAPLLHTEKNSHYLFMLHIGFGAQHSQHKRAGCVYTFLPDVQIK